MFKKFVMSVIIISVFLVCFSLSATASDPGYTINSYDININVNNNNTYDITENIAVQFSSPKRGINLKIPKSYEFTSNAGSSSKVRAIISNFNISSPDGATYKESSNGIYEIFKLGSSDTFAESNTKYSFRYNFDLGNDNNQYFDEIPLYLIGNGWDTSISNVTFKVNLPKSFDRNNLFIGSETDNSKFSDSSSVSYSIDGNLITGKVDRDLQPGERLILTLKLPDGYFTNTSQTFHSYSFLTAIFIIIAVAALILWYFFGRNKKVQPELTNYPPEGYNSAELAYILKGKLFDCHTLSLILYLASKGYIKIEQIESSSMFNSKKKLLFVKLKEYDGTNLAEQYLFDGLFGDKEKVSTVELNYLFNSVMGMTAGAIDSKENRNSLFKKSSRILKSSFVVLAVLVFAAANIACAIDYSDDMTLALFTTIFPLTGIFLFIYGIKSFKSSRSNAIYLIVFSVVWLVLSLAAMLFPLIITPLASNPGLIPPYITACIYSTILFILWPITLKRTDCGNELFTKALGLKEYMINGGTESFYQASDQSTQNNYELLPFAFAFDITKKWAKGYNYNTAVPIWYESIDDFSITDFCKIFNSAMLSIPTSYKGRRSNSNNSW